MPTTLTCAISGLSIQVTYCDNLKLHYTAGYYHPIFAASNKQLHAIYSRYIANELSPVDSYLLFLAFVHQSGLVDWQNPVAVQDPAAPLITKHIANYMARVISVVARSEAIKHPEFQQPTCRVSHKANSLPHILAYIRTWEANIDDFLLYRKELAAAERLNRIANKLEAHIKSAASLDSYTKIIADWAHTAAVFPAAKVDQYKAIITACCNKSVMFNTPLALIKEVKEYCEENIEVGSIHYHTLNKALTLAVRNHIDYLGTTYTTSDYSIASVGTSSLATNTDAIKSQLTEAIKNAPITEPIAAQYPNKLEFIKAKLAYRLAQSSKSTNTPPEL